MIEKERQVLIMEKIRRSGFVSVRELMKELNASRSSIMRDLARLEESGLLKREHGGASLPELNALLSKKTEPAVFEKESLHAEEKRRIAMAASSLVRDGSLVFADTGTTAACLAEALKDRDVSIVTPSVYFIRRLERDAKCTVYLLGGQYDCKYDMNAGEYAMAMLDCYRFDTAFLSASAIDLSGGDVMAADFSLAAMKQAVMKRSRRNILLADASKFGCLAACTFAKVSDFEKIYTSETKRSDLSENIIIVKEK